MRTVILWIHMCLCAFWTVFLMGFAIFTPDEVFGDPGTAIPVLLALATSASGVYLFVSHAFLTLSRQSELKRQNKILRRELEQEELKAKLNNLRRESREPAS